MTDDMFTFGNTDEGWMVHIHYDGTLAIEGDLDEAAQGFWRLVAEARPVLS